MAKEVTFKVSKRGGASTECTFLAPESLEDPRWEDVVSNPAEDINELALQNLIIKIQSGARDELVESGSTAAQEYVNTYKYGARAGGFKRPTVSASAQATLGFTEEQIAELKRLGVKFGVETDDAQELEFEETEA